MDAEVLLEVARDRGVDVEEILRAASGDVALALNRLLDGDDNGSRTGPLKIGDGDGESGGKKRKQSSMLHFLGKDSERGDVGVVHKAKNARIGSVKEKVAVEAKQLTLKPPHKKAEHESYHDQEPFERDDVVHMDVKGSASEGVHLTTGGDTEALTPSKEVLSTQSSVELIDDVESQSRKREESDLNLADGMEQKRPSTEEDQLVEASAAGSKNDDGVPRSEVDGAPQLKPSSSHEKKFEERGELKTGYDPLSDPWWKDGEPTPYLHLARTFEIVSKTPSRIKTLELLSGMLRSVLRKTPTDLLPTLYLCSSRLAPAWEGIELGLGGHALAQAIREATGSSRPAMSKAYIRLGDMGDVAQELKVSVRTIFQPQSLSVCKVYDTLLTMAKDKGTGSVSRKKNAAKRLFVSCREMEMRWIVRTLIQNLRMGAVVKTLLTALGHAVALEYDDAKDRESATEAIVEAFSRCPSFEILVKALMMDGSWRNCKSACEVRPGIPIKPQLGRITRDPAELMNRFGDVRISCEFKYDGQRAQLHILEDQTVRVFSRHLEDVTGRYEGVVPCTTRALLSGLVKSAVLDAEVVAVDRLNQDGPALLPFQTLSARSKKVDVCIMVFDLLYLNGETLLKRNLAERRQLLQRNFELTPGEFEMVQERTVSEPDEVKEWLEEAVKKGAEGLMCKTLDGPLSTYEPALRSDGWAKIKKDYVDGLTGSLDLVPIAAWWGNGRKAGWFSPFLLACYCDGEFQSVCKVMSGYSDQQYKELTAFYLDGHTLPEKPAHYVVGTGISPSVWLEACQVWEVKGADFTMSPVHLAAIGKVTEDRGISVRFPRFIGIRDDKAIEDATTADEIADMYLSQPNPARNVEVQDEDAMDE